MKSALDLLSRIDAILETTSTPKIDESAHLQSVLSGAFGRRILVKEGIHGTPCALVPAEELKSCGLVVTESIVPGIAPILVGNEASVKNACRCVAKRAGEGWEAKLEGFDPVSRRTVFGMHRGTPGTHTKV